MKLLCSGERGPLEGSARTATVTTKCDMITYAISRQRLLALAERNPSAREAMFEHVRERYAD